jgi:hypothetical protein
MIARADDFNKLDILIITHASGFTKILVHSPS